MSQQIHDQGNTEQIIRADQLTAITVQLVQENSVECISGSALWGGEYGSGKFRQFYLKLVHAYSYDPYDP